jgi:actin-like ATPase involved in cell morphogenesis
MGLFNFLTQEIAIDLGTANTLIIHNDKVVVDEPSIVAVDRTDRKSNCCWKASTCKCMEKHMKI